MQKKQSVSQLSANALQGKTALIRVDFNVPIQDGAITDDTRIQAALPTIQYVLDAGGRCVLISHFGRPQGKRDMAFSLTPVAKHLESCLQVPFMALQGCVEENVVETVKSRKDISVFLLENSRFYPEETDNDVGFSKKLSALGDLFIQDAFGAVHRAHASTAGVAAFLPTYAGLLVEKELTYLDTALSNPKRPFVAIVGGAKVSSKMAVLSHLLTVVDTLVIGGGMAFTFLKAQGKSIGTSLVESDKCDMALALLSEAKRMGKRIVLPTDVIVSNEFGAGPAADIETVDVDNIPASKMGLDVGPRTLAEIEGVLQDAETVVWNGPMGVFEINEFAQGTYEIARFLADSNAITIVGGGDSVAAVKKSGLADQMDHISTGGGACLEYLEGNVLPGVACIGESK